MTQLIAVLFTFQSPYLFTIGDRGVFSLAGWSRQLHAKFHEFGATLEHLSTPISVFAYGAITRYGRTFQSVLLTVFQLEVSTTPVRRLVWACPFSLAATNGIHVCFFSCRYLDVSVPYVRFCTLCIHVQIPLRVSFLIQKSPDQCLFASFPELIAGFHVFHRLSIPRHPPYTLNSLTTFIDHRL